MFFHILWVGYNVSMGHIPVYTLGSQGQNQVSEEYNVQRSWLSKDPTSWQGPFIKIILYTCSSIQIFNFSICNPVPHKAVKFSNTSTCVFIEYYKLHVQGHQGLFHISNTQQISVSILRPYLVPSLPPYLIIIQDILC